ncbi:nucleoside phosphorylase [Carboxylicivirga sp. M1479]|uniref:nucleoside phosphorylase n=1 Tax=Carboxylicivirga sp. M1479 TaxID=2594476 RepID=UPI001178C197|nr:nucleoside phosphorylase [Carboxylicivirga sp. M1479]TRX70749.1 phosphorylase [Carboxylicivirga sp. M1479]
MQKIEASELIINPDGSVFHLHLKPGDVAKDIILVGDPGRVELISSFFDTIELKKSNREFVSCTGTYNNKRITVVATGIGTDNIDIVVNELDALVNIDFDKRTVKQNHTQLNFVRIGTSGALQQDLPVDSWLLSEKAIGFDGLLNFYANRNKVVDLPFEQAFTKDLNWNPLLTAPYVVNAADNLLSKLEGNNVVRGVTISAPGFYGPQGRELRLKIADRAINDKISDFRYESHRITNYEMECSAIYGLSALLGHQAATVCVIIANRLAGTASKDYKPVMKALVAHVLNGLTQ